MDDEAISFLYLHLFKLMTFYNFKTRKNSTGFQTITLDEIAQLMSATWITLSDFQIDYKDVYIFIWSDCRISYNYQCLKALYVYLNIFFNKRCHIFNKSNSLNPSFPLYLRAARSSNRAGWRAELMTDCLA